MPTAFPSGASRRRSQRIAPGQTVDVGQISTSPTHVDLGAKVILTAVDDSPLTVAPAADQPA